MINKFLNFIKYAHNIIFIDLIRRWNNIPEFYLGEKIIFIVLCVNTVGALFASKSVEEFLFLIFFEILSFIFLTVEHKWVLIFSREIDTLTVARKALFRNIYDIHSKLALSDIETAETYSIQRKNSRGGISYYYYSLELALKNNSTYKLGDIIGFHSSYKNAEKEANVVNEFLSNNSPNLIITGKPCLYRIIGIILFVISHIPTFNMYYSFLSKVIL